MISDVRLTEWEQYAHDRQAGAYDPLIDYLSARWLLEAINEIRAYRATTAVREALEEAERIVFGHLSNGMGHVGSIGEEILADLAALRGGTG